MGVARIADTAIIPTPPVKIRKNILPGGKCVDILEIKFNRHPVACKYYCSMFASLMNCTQQMQVVNPADGSYV